MIRFMCDRKNKAFTLIELLIVVSIIGLLLAVLMPALGAARSGSRALACKSNLRQLVIANIGYATESDGYYVPAASDMWDNAGLHRWHGRRDALDKPFDPLRGPLIGYHADAQEYEDAGADDLAAEHCPQTHAVLLIAGDAGGAMGSAPDRRTAGRRLAR